VIAQIIQIKFIVVSLGTQLTTELGLSWYCDWPLFDCNVAEGCRNLRITAYTRGMIALLPNIPDASATALELCRVRESWWKGALSCLAVVFVTLMVVVGNVESGECVSIYCVLLGYAPPELSM
jgi:hypothetical protein